MRTNPRLAVLATEYTNLRGGLDYLDDLAAAEGRDLNTDERAAYDGALTRSAEITTEVEGIKTRSAGLDADAEAMAKLVNAAPTHTRTEHVAERSPFSYDPAAVRPYQRPSASIAEIGDYAMTVTRSRFGRLGVDKFRAFAGDEETLTRTLAHGVSADGTAPITIEGDLIKFIDSQRYVVNACRQLPMPDNHAPSFKRPRATQFTTVGQQVNEGDVLSSQRFQNTGDLITKTTQGGALSLSEQEIDWTDPALLGLAIQDLAAQYAIDTDTLLATAISTAALDANETVLSLTANAAAVVTAVAAAAAQVYSTAKRMADVIFVDVNRWAFLAGLTDGDGRPIFPIAGPFNTAGVNNDGVANFSGLKILGLEVVVDPNFTSNFWAVGVSQLCEFYEQNKGLLSINVPSTLEVTYAYRGYAAANVYSQALSPFDAA